MKTLDKAISMSSDQLDTLTSERMRSMMQSVGQPVRASYRLPPPGQNNVSAAPATGADGNVIFKYKGAEYSKNEYFFGIKSEQSNKKTAYQMFLEDDGPYSRKLFGPIAQKVENGSEKLSFRNFVYKSKRHFTLVRTFIIFYSIPAILPWSLGLHAELKHSEFKLGVNASPTYCVKIAMFVARNLLLREQFCIRKNIFPL